jgi:predicted dehydrogenase
MRHVARRTERTIGLGVTGSRTIYQDERQVIRNPRKAIGLVGCGLWGRNILRDLISLGCRVQVADPCAENRQSAIETGAENAVNDVKRLGELDGYVVATPAGTHAEVADHLLKFLKPVFVEKPFTVDSASAEMLASKGSNLLFVMHNWRYHPGIRMLGEIASSGEFGPVTGLYSSRMNWTSPRKDVDTSWTMLPHDLSISLAIFGSIPEPVHACAEVLDGRVVGLTVMLGGNPWTVFTVSNRVADKRREVRLHCRDGVATLPHGESRFLEIATPDGTGGLRANIERRPVEGNSALHEELKSFVAFLEGGPPPPTTAKEGLDVVRKVEQIRRLIGVHQRDG